MVIELLIEDQGTQSIKFSVDDANGVRCTYSSTISHDPFPDTAAGERLIMDGINDADAILGSFEAWRFLTGVADATYYVGRTCLGSCIQTGHWCTHPSNQDFCFPTGIYIVKGTQNSTSLEIYISRPFAGSDTISCDLLTAASKSYLGTSPTCSYDSTKLTLTVVPDSTDHTVNIGIDLCLDESNIYPVVVTTNGSTYCYTSNSIIAEITLTRTPDSGNWDVGDSNQFEYSITNSGANIVDTYTWTKQIGPAISFTSNSPIQSFSPNTLTMGYYLIYIHVEFTNFNEYYYPSFPLTVGFTVTNVNHDGFVVFEFTLSTATLTISSCSDIFDAASVTSFGTSPTCNYVGSLLTLTVDELTSTLVTGSYIVYQHTNLIPPLSYQLTKGISGLNSLAPSILPNSGLWDTKDTNKWEITVNNPESLTTDTITWTKDSGPALTLSSEVNIQSYTPESLLIGDYVISYSMNFTTGLTLSHTFTSQKVGFSMIGGTQDGNRIELEMSTNQLSITSCSSIFSAGTVTSLGAMATCAFDAASKTLIVEVASDHTLSLGSELTFSSTYMYTNNFTLTANLPSIITSISPAFSEWNAGVTNDWSSSTNDLGTLVIDQITWAKVSGPALTFASNVSTQTYSPDALFLGDYVVSVTINFTNSSIFTLSKTFTSQKVVCEVSSVNQTGSKFEIELSSSKLSIWSCSDIFETTTVSKLGGASSSCTFTPNNKTLTAFASESHTLASGNTLEYNSYINSTDYTLGEDLPSATIAISPVTWTLNASLPYTVTITPQNINPDIPAVLITYEFVYNSGPFSSYAFPVVGSSSTLSAHSLLPGGYNMTAILRIESYNNYTYQIEQMFVVKASLIDLSQAGPLFSLTFDCQFTAEYSSSSELFEPASVSLLGGSGAINKRKLMDNSTILIYAGNTSTLTIGDNLVLLSDYFLNNTFMCLANLPIIDNLILSEPTKFWNRESAQSVTISASNIIGLDSYFAFEYHLSLSGNGDISGTEVTKFSSENPGTFARLSIPSSGVYTLTGKLILNDTTEGVDLIWAKEATDITVSKIPYPGAIGINASIPVAMDINISSTSIDRDTGTASDDLSYLWECFTDKDLSLPFSSWIPKTDLNFTLPKGYFPVGIYYIKLLVTKYSFFSAFTHGILNITNANIKLEISSPNLSDLRSDIATTFSAESVSLTGSSNYKVEWDINPDIYRFYTNDADLTIPAHILIPGGNYTIRSIVIGTSDSTRALSGDIFPQLELDIQVAKTIIVGHINVSPQEGEGLTTFFTITADSWADPNSKPLIYRFGFQIVGSTSLTYFSDWDISNSVANIKLPPGKDIFYNFVTLIVQAKNEENSTAIVKRNITITQIVIADKKQFVEDLLGDASTDNEKISAIVNTAYLVEVDANYAKIDACGGCDTKHGSCDPTTRKCLCDSDYDKSPLCQISNSNVEAVTQVAEVLSVCNIYIYIYI